MSTSVVGVVNVGLVLLGEPRILSMDDNVKAARSATEIYETTRDALIAAYDWAYAKTRTSLPALTSTPDFEYDYEYQLPSDSLRLVTVGRYYVGLDLTDYRGSPTAEFALEGRKILTSLSAPLPIRYIKRVTDVAQWDPCFSLAMSMRMAELLAETLTQSDTKRQRATDAFNKAIRDAVRANAIQRPPDKLADDEWLISRL